jgi:hypothetical protein
MLSRRIVLVLLAVGCCHTGFGQDSFTETSIEAVQNALLEYANNREKFKAFGCLGLIESDRNAFDARVREGLVDIRFCIFEDFASRSVRKDWKSSDLLNDENKSLGWRTHYVGKEKGDNHYLLGDQEFDLDTKKLFLEEFWHPRDPWTLSIVDKFSMQYDNRGDSMYWMQLFDAKEFLWAEEKDDFIRAEFSMESFSRVQVYFSKSFGSMPVYCRYFSPVDIEKKFSKRSKAYMNEIETTWEERREGWVPIKVRNYRENYSGNGSLRSSECWSIKLTWDTSFQDDEDHIDPNVFVKKKITSEELMKSFKDSKSEKR